MKWKQYWDAKSLHSNSLEQVGRAGNEEKFTETLQYLEGLVKPSKNDVLLDLCCGNGLVSAFFASKVKRIVAVDLSPKLLANARKNNNENTNITYIESNAKEVNSKLAEKVNVALLHFSFQYFEKYNEGKKVIKALRECLVLDGKIAISDIPNFYKRKQIFTGIFGELRFWKQRFFGGEMGRFWKPKELQKIAKHLGLKCEVLMQPRNLPYSHYRFDVVLSK